MKKTNFKSLLAIVALVGIIGTMPFLTSCKKSTSVAPTLYDSVGGSVMVKDPKSSSGAMIEAGRLALRSVVDSTIFVIAADGSLNNKFFSVLLGEVGKGNLSGFTELSMNLTDFFCVATGAKSFKYTGMDMVSAHDPAKNSRMGTKATSADFDLFVGDLVKGAQQNGVSNDLIANHIGPLVYTLKSQVVQK